MKREHPQKEAHSVFGHTLLVSLEILKNPNIHDRGHKFQSVIICDRHRCLKMSQIVTNLVLLVQN